MSDVFKIVRPTWLDPRFVGAASDFSVRSFLFDTFQVQRLALNDPTRVMIGFRPGLNGGVAAGNFVGPDPTYDTGGWKLTDDVIWFSLLSHGPLVCSEWYIKGTAGGTVTVYEVNTSGG